MSENFRILNKDDSFQYSQLRNEKNTYKWFYSQRIFSENEVEEWIKNLNESNEVVFVLEIETKIIGTISIYNIQNGNAEVGRIITSEYLRGQGVGTKLLQYAINYSKIRLGLKFLYANIMVENIASQRTFEKNNFKKVKENNQTGYYYELEIK